MSFGPISGYVIRPQSRLGRGSHTGKIRLPAATVAKFESCGIFPLAAANDNIPRPSASDGILTNCLRGGKITDSTVSLPMKLTVIVPTFDRANSLRNALASLASASVPTGLKVEVIVVDNNSTDRTAYIVEEMQPHFADIELRYVFEPKQGRSFAVNTGIKIAQGDLISTVDDDEQVSESWFTEIHRVFGENWEELDFAGGKILPNLEIEPPIWVEPLKIGALCWRDFGDEPWTYDDRSPIVTGAHGIFKRSVFESIGLYNEHLGVKGKGFLGGEDEVFYDQLMRSGCRGLYYPKLVVYHDVPARRLTKKFYRRWLLGVGMSRRIADLNYKAIDGARIFDIPLWMFRAAAQGCLEKMKFIIKRDEAGALAAENRPLVFVGFVYGAHIRGSWVERVILKIATKFTEPTSR